MTATLDPLDLPLWGSRLIGASAGTGKTWTIAALVLRLVLGHGERPDGRAPRPLLPAEVLVMTFTRAATRELSDRIRSRLIEAARCFRGEAGPAPGDTLLPALLAAHPEGALRRQAAWRLALAADAMDEAAVFTIDAWCQRMLREHAFDTGCLFDEDLAPDERTLTAEAALDCWRAEVYPLAGPALAAVLAIWPTPAALADDVAALMPQLPLPPVPATAADLAGVVAQVTAGRGAALARLKQGWSARAQAMQTWLVAQLADDDGPFDRKTLTAANGRRWTAALAAWAEDATLERPAMNKGAERLTPAGLRGVARRPDAVHPPPEFAAFAVLLAALDTLPDLAPALRLHAATRVAERLARLKRQAARFGFADLLARLDGALDPARNGDAALRLRDRIVAQYPAALIDEFQDTSPVQARIFDRLYRIADNDPATALLLIGDPKQAIYGFRGADIHSYLDVRRKTAGRHHVLGTNHRSAAALVGAVNHLFAGAEARVGQGAFLFRDGDENALPFTAVAAQGRAERWVTAGGPPPALTLELDATLVNGKEMRHQGAARCAEHIAQLLNDAQAGFDHPHQGFTRLRPADIAVLVRTGTEGAAVRRALRLRGIASVYLSDQDSVFASAEAADLLHWLRAVASPHDLRLARAAFATRLASLPLTELARLADSDEAFDARSEQLRRLHAAWQGQGVLPMLRQSLHALDLPARWLGEGGDGQGERRLTNCLHLAELLQATSARLEGEQALIRWLAGQIRSGAVAIDEQIVRLESDADLVKVVTVHMSKGLEYPLVFLPFANSFRARGQGDGGFVTPVDTATGERRLELRPSASQLAAADHERMREDLRLLYVALTRARHAVWVGLAALKVGMSAGCLWHRSAIGTVLGGQLPQAALALPAVVRAAVAGVPGIRLQMAAAPEAVGRTRLRAAATAPPLRLQQPYHATFDRRWAVGSFSGLVRALAAPLPLVARTAAARDDEVDDAGSASLQEAVAMTAPWHAFQRGAQAGNFLHDQLEWLAAEGFALAGSPALQQQLRRRCERQGHGERASAVLDWLERAVTRPLPPLGAALMDLHRPLPEMEFWLPSENLPAAALDALCRAHLLPGQDRPALPERALHGLLMGFADLVFEHGGRWWVLDYKSNHLGTRDGDYTEEALAQAVLAHRYDVQAGVYLLALHRLLRSRLGADYAPERQLGGAVFFFLRGLNGPAGGCCTLPAPPPFLQALDTLLTSTAEAAP